MAVGLRFFNEKIWLDKYFMTLTFKEKFIWLYLITKKSTGGIFSENIASIEGVLNSTTIIEKIDNEEEYNESDYVTRKDISRALRKFDADKKLIKMEDGFYFFVNFYQNQNFKSQNNLEGVMARTEELITKNKNIAEHLRLYPIYFEQLGDEIIEQLKKETTEKNKDISLGYKQRMFLKYAKLHDKVKVFFSKKVTDYLQANLSMNYTYLYTKSGTKSQPSQDQVGDNYNLNLNPNFNFNFNLKEKLIVKDSIVKNKEINIESSKNPSLGGQVFEDSQDGSQEPSREGLSERANAVISSRVISDYFRKAFKKFEMDVDPVVGSNIIEIEVKNYKTHKELETDARELVEYLVSSETIKEVTTVHEFPKMLKWYRSKIAPKLRDKLKDDKLYQSEEKVAQI